MPETVIDEAAKIISQFRAKAQEGERPPGAAEFLDLLRVVGGLGGTPKAMQENIQDLHEIVLLKGVVESD